MRLTNTIKAFINLPIWQFDWMLIKFQNLRCSSLMQLTLLSPGVQVSQPFKCITHWKQSFEEGDLKATTENQNAVKELRHPCIIPSAGKYTRPWTVYTANSRPYIVGMDRIIIILFRPDTGYMLSYSYQILAYRIQDSQCISTNQQDDSHNKFNELVIFCKNIVSWDTDNKQNFRSYIHTVYY